MKLILLAFLLSSVVVFADTSADLLDQIKAEARAEVKSARESQNEAQLARVNELQQFLVALDRWDENDVSGGEPVRTLEMLSTTTTSEKLAGLCRTLAAQLKMEREKNDAVLVAEMKKGFGAALRAGLAAKTTKDLDAPMSEVAVLLQRSRFETTANAVLRELGNEGRQLWQFLRQWQDYLGGVSSDEYGGRQQQIQNLVRSGENFSAFMPRSEFLERVAELQKGTNGPAKTEMTIAEMDAKTREVLAATRRLADLPGSIEKLQELGAMRPPNGYSQLLSAALQSLTSFDRVRLDLDNGLATAIHLSTVLQNANSEVDELLSPVRAQLLLYALPRLLEVPEADHPEPSETVPAYLHRMAVSAREKSEWTRLARTLDTMTTLRIESAAAESDRGALQSFLAGLNQEKAMQYAFAVISYEQALKTGSQLISAELIGDHLERIQKEHPQEYQQGVENSLNPPAPANPRTGFPPGFPYVPDLQKHR